MALTETDVKSLVEKHDQGHILRTWDELDESQRNHLLGQIDGIDFRLVERLVEKWVRGEPEPDHFEKIEPVPVIDKVDSGREDCNEAKDAGEHVLRAGRVGLVTVAGGQGTRLGFDGPKGAYPIGPITGKTLFAYHAEKIHNIQNTYGTTVPWYIMVSDANRAETEAFFADNNHFGLDATNIIFFQQRMMPCVDDDGKFMLDDVDRLAMNPNGHGGCIPALVENGIIAHAKERDIDTLSYIQVDNWAVKVADPYFIGFHTLRKSEFSSKVHRKKEPRESVGVHCVCDGEYRVIEYSELDIYPQLLETDDQGSVIHYAGNPAIHVLDIPFIERVYARFDEFPWHMAHKKVPFLDENGNHVEPEEPNAYKFETFIFDALRFAKNQPVYLEIDPPGEYTPIKQKEGPNSVAEARRSQANYWGRWFEKAGFDVPRSNGDVTVPIEVSPRFAGTEDQFLSAAKGKDYNLEKGIAIESDGSAVYPS